MMKSTKIVNLFAGPGAGKSTGAAYVFAKLKLAGVNAELVTEFAKEKVWEGDKEAFENQMFIIGSQMHRLACVFGKVDVIVTDSPVLLAAAYADPYTAKSVLSQADDKGWLHSSVNFLIKRVKKYNPDGRNESEAQAEAIDEKIRKYLDESHVEYEEVTGDLAGYDMIVSEVLLLN